MSRRGTGGAGASATLQGWGLNATIGPYRLLRELGRGGMGVVYEAVHEPLGHRVALKIISRSFAASEPKAARRLLSEVRALRSVEHEGIVRLSGVGALADGAPYLVMEFLAGETLRSRLERLGRVPPEQALPIIGQLAEALSAVHGHGLLHRDIKPSNVMLVPDGFGGERAKLLDFGLARPAETTDTLTGSGNAVGTPRYMAPEQSAGASLSAAADVYSLGVVLHEMLYGALPTAPQTGSPERAFSGWASAPTLLLQRMLAAAPAMRPGASEVAQRLRAMTAMEPMGATRAVHHGWLARHVADAAVALFLIFTLSFVVLGLLPKG